LTTSMPPEAQHEILATVPGLENARILRYGYAIEYDALAPGTMHKTMESRVLAGLYTAGQINGTSGYEEAAAQGLAAGLNAALSLLGRPAWVPSRTRGYIGVLVDDLSGWDHPEPYRITPSHAEFRLHLREESAERRLLADGFACGLVPAGRHRAINAWLGRIGDELRRLGALTVTPSIGLRERLARTGTGDLKKQVTALEILARPGIRYADLADLLGNGFQPALTEPDEIEFLENEARYAGYAEREAEQMRVTRHLEAVRLPLALPERVRAALTPPAREIVEGRMYDDLVQPMRKRCLDRGDLAILSTMMSPAEPFPPGEAPR